MVYNIKSEKCNLEENGFLEAYLDNSATTKPCKRACEAALRTMENDFGNPSSLHKKGFDAMQILESARGVIAKSLGVDLERIFFTPSGTVANNTAIFRPKKSPA